MLADKSQPDAARLEALKYVVHFVGDAHQPLHDANNHDSGGDAVLVSYLGQTSDSYGKPLNLYAVWDSEIIERRLASGKTVLSRTPVLAKQLEREIAPADASARQADANPADWATEGHKLAITPAYTGIAAPGSADPKSIVTLDTAYDAKAWPVGEGQWEKAGVRLATALNAALGS